MIEIETLEKDLGERPRDREGWRIQPGARCYRFTSTGFQLAEQVVVIGFGSSPKHPVTVRVEGLTSGNMGETLPDRLLVLPTPEGDKAPMKVQRYRARKKDVILLKDLEERKAAERKARKVKRKQG